MFIKSFEVGHLETNCYIVTDEKSLKCAVIDPGDESNVILDYLESNKLKCEAIFLTHGHFDHTRAADTVAEETGADIYINEADISDGSSHDFYRFKTDRKLNKYSDGDEIMVGSLLFRVIATPGHSKGSVTLMCEDALFTGDTLFRGSCGRTDLPGGDMQELMSSLKKLSKIEGQYEVYPGHMDATDLDREKNFNYYMNYACDEI